MNKLLPASAFTLIEVLVVVGIMGILTALTIPKFSQFSSTRLLDRNARNLEIDINSLKVKAISGASQSSHNARWGIKINCNSSSYELGYSLDDGSGSYGAGVFVSTKNLSDGITFSSGCGQFFFERLTGKIADGSDSKTIIISKGSDTRTINVYKNGKIDVQ